MGKMSGSLTGPSVRFVSASLPTQMIIVKLGDGSLWFNSRETLDQIDVIGPVRYLVAYTALHIWKLEQVQAACRRLRDQQQQNGTGWNW
jgi:hypothetical protein